MVRNRYLNGEVVRLDGALRMAQRERRRISAAVA